MLLFESPRILACVSNLGTIFIAFLITTCNAKSCFSPSLNIIIFGDSVDRNSIVEWCDSHGAELIVNTRMDYIERRCQSLAQVSGNDSLKHLANKRFKNEEFLVMCHNKNLNLVISYIWNPVGVFIDSPCNIHSTLPQKQAFLAIESVPMEMRHEKIMNSSLFPMIELVKDMTGNRIDGVMFQSHFWDIDRLWHCGNFDEMGHYLNWTEGVNASVVMNYRKQAEYIDSWVGNLSIFSNLLLRYIDNNVSLNEGNGISWKGWRANNAARLWNTPAMLKPGEIIDKKTNRWWNHIGLSMLNQMHDRGIALATKNSLNVIDFHLFAELDKHWKDDYHPGPTSSAAMIQYLVNAVNCSKLHSNSLLANGTIVNVTSTIQTLMRDMEELQNRHKMNGKRNPVISHRERQSERAIHASAVHHNQNHRSKLHVGNH